MSILRNYLRNNFSMIPNEILTDKNISFGARLVYCYLASKPDNWKIWNEDIKKQVGIKDNGTLSKYWKELIDSNWLVRERMRDETGKITGGFNYQLNNPYIENNHIRENSIYGENQEHNNTDLDSNTNINNNTDNICSVIKDNIQEFFEKYNSTVKRLPKARVLTDKRKNKIRCRLKEIPDINEWEKIFKRCDNSDFCAGISSSGSWVASLDFIIENQTNYNKILEGRYDNKVSLRNPTTNNRTLEELQKQGMDLL